MDERFSHMIEESAKGSVILILGQMIATLISALGAIFIARLLGSTSYGIISIASIPVSLANMLLNNGVSNAMINNIVDDRLNGEGKKIRSIIFTGFTINLTIGLLSSLSIYLLAGYFANQVFSQPELKEIIQILSITTVANSIFNLSGSILVGFEKMRQRSIMNILTSTLKSTIGPVLVYLGFGVFGAAYGYSLPNLIAGLLGVSFILYILNQYPQENPLFCPEEFKRVFQYSIPLFFSNLLAGSLVQVLNFILPFYVSASLIGNNTAANSFAVLISFFLVPISTATFPLLSKLNPDDQIFGDVFRNIIKYETMIAYPVSAFVISYASHLVSLLYGDDYLHAPLYIQILMSKFLFIGFGETVTFSLLNSQKQTQVTLRRTLIYVFFGIPLGLILIPRYGIVGFQIATLFTPPIGLLYVLWWLRNNMGLQLDLSSTFKMLISAILGYIATIIVQHNVKINLIGDILLGGIILVIIYVLSILSLGALTKRNITDIQGIFERYDKIQWLSVPLFNLLRFMAKAE